MASALRIALAGFGLIRARPRAVLAWGFVYLAFTIVGSLLTRPMMERVLLAMPQGGGQPMPAALDWSISGPILVMNIGMLGMFVILLAAAMRAMLKPAEQGAFFIRVGIDELRLLGTVVLIVLMLIGLYIVSIVVLAIVGGVGAVALGGPGADGARPMLALLAVALVLLEFALLLAFQVRFALALPLSILRGRIVVREAWRRSKGHFWPLFGGFLLNGLILVCIMLLVSLPVLLSYYSDGGIMAALVDPQRQIAAMRSPWLYPMWLLMPMFGGLTVAMAGGALGAAVLETEPAAG